MPGRRANLPAAPTATYPGTVHTHITRFEMTARSVRRDAARTFQDRREAGRVLAQRLVAYRGRADVLVLGLARGGVPIGWEVAHSLTAPLDVFVVRKLGVPQWEELAMGAVASGGGLVINQGLVDRLGIDEDTLLDTIRDQTAEVRRRERAYRGARPSPDVSHRTVLLVDDGIATGASMLAAVRAVRPAGRIVVAVPVGPATVCPELLEEADEVVCASTPTPFEAVGQAFADFHQVTDDEVHRLLATPTVGVGQAFGSSTGSSPVASASARSSDADSGSDSSG